MLLRRVVEPAHATHLSMGLELRFAETAPSMFVVILFLNHLKATFHLPKARAQTELWLGGGPGRGKGTSQKSTFSL